MLRGNRVRGTAILTAAGSGSRFGRDKIWQKIGNETLLERSVRPFLSCPAIDDIIVVVRAERLEEARALFADCEKPVRVLIGGETRTESVRNALLFLKERVGAEETVVAIHDGARPFVTEELILRCMNAAINGGSAVPVVPCTDSLRLCEEGGSKAVDRTRYYAVQTPQCFLFSRIYDAYLGAADASDDATLYEKKYGNVSLVEGDERNKKITYSSDFSDVFERRVGIGYDVHPLKEGRPLVLGGQNIPFPKGLDGHSDGDVLLHAVMDALLTAADLPDIGHFFPPSDLRYEGIYSLTLLEKVYGYIFEKGFVVENVSATIMAERPKLAPYLPSMEATVARALHIEKARVRFAATTTESLGIVGEGRGMAAEAVALLSKTSF